MTTSYQPQVKDLLQKLKDIDNPTKLTEEKKAKKGSRLDERQIGQMTAIPTASLVVRDPKMSDLMRQARSFMSESMEDDEEVDESKDEDCDDDDMVEESKDEDCDDDEMDESVKSRLLKSARVLGEMVRSVAKDLNEYKVLPTASVRKNILEGLDGLTAAAGSLKRHISESAPKKR